MNTVFGGFGLFFKAERFLFLVVWGGVLKKTKHYIKLSVITLCFGLANCWIIVAKLLDIWSWFKWKGHLTNLYYKKKHSLNRNIFFLLSLNSPKHLLLTPTVHDPVQVVHIKLINKSKEGNLLRLNYSTGCTFLGSVTAWQYLMKYPIQCHFFINSLKRIWVTGYSCLLYTSDAADEDSPV